MSEIRGVLGQRMLFFDGAMGTLLQAAGLPAGAAPESWNLERPEAVKACHAAYLAAGCDVIATNTFGANGVKLELPGHTVEEVVSAGVALARQAVEEAGRGWVALDMGPTGRLLKPMGDLGFEAAADAFAVQVEAGVKAGADLILIETMSDLYEAKAAVLAAKEHSDLPVFITLIFDEGGKLLTGGDIPAAVALLEGLGVDALGLNCGLGPRQMAALFPTLREYTSLPILVNPNAGLPQCVDGCTRFAVGPEEFAADVAELARAGAWGVGGCCGTTPEHIAALVREAKDIAPLPIKTKRRTWVSSYARAVEFGAEPVLIGERINPTGKARLKQALREGDLDYILREGAEQQKKGAMVLDVNLGLPEVDEGALMARVIPELQGVTELPLQIDTADPAVMERALRLYNGRPLINSVSGKEESMAAVFPLMKKYGGSAIALTLDDRGIPATARERLEVARKIAARAAEHGIPKEDLIFDPLAMTISADQSSARTTLEALELIRRELGCCTSLGVSNVSFGLPAREQVNAAFLLLALEKGLSAAIINPNSPAMMEAFRAWRALKGLDSNCEAYIAAQGQAPAAPVPAQTDSAPEVGEAVARGLKDTALAAAKAALESRGPMDIINSDLIPALDRVGKDFEAGRLYLPQLLRSAEAAKGVFELLREKLPAQGGGPAVKGTVVVATVKGDVHDIGKNIAKVLLENYGYRVVDLGKDVPPGDIVEAVRRERAQLAGLSALMTTTVGAMEETIRLLREECPDCRIMAGGAVLTEEYARSLGADCYVKDAMADVRYADGVTGNGSAPGNV